MSSQGKIKENKEAKARLSKQEQEFNDLRIKFFENAFSDVYYFAAHVTPNLLKFDVPEFHKEIYRLLPRRNRLAIAAPRGFAKSTITSVIYPLWLALSGVLYKNIMIVSASESLAVELLRKIKLELETNEIIQKFWGDMRTDKWSETHIILKGGVSIVAKGAGAQMRGFRPDCLILDDIEDDEGVESEETRRKLKDWLFKACLNTLLPSGQFLMVGTILSPLSLLTDILETNNGWEKRKYMAYIDGIEADKNELWPSLWSHENLQKRKAEIGSYSFSCEYMNSPVEDGVLPIKDSQIRYWKDLPENLNYYIALDPAYSEGPTSDYKVAVLVGVDSHMNRYLAHYIRTRSMMTDYMDKVLSMWRMHSNDVIALGVPCSGTEREFHRSFTEFCNTKGYFPPITELKNVFKDGTNVSHRNKKRRIIASLQPIFEAGKYFIGEGHDEARSELLSIGVSKHDDTVDAMAYVESLVMNLGEEATLKEEKKRPWWEEEESFPMNNYGYVA